MPCKHSHLGIAGGQTSNEKVQETWKVFILDQSGNMNKPQRLLLGLLHGPGFVFPPARGGPPRKDMERWEWRRTAPWLLFISLFWGQGEDHYPKEILAFIHRGPWFSIPHIKLAIWPSFFTLVRSLLGRNCAFYLVNLSSEHCEQIRIRSPGLFPNKY